MQWWQILLFPFSILLHFITSWRNYFYDKQLWKSYQAPIPTINVGNLTVGGTGKSPHIEYLIRLLKTKYQITTLSRGYGRKTKGFRWASASENAYSLGDEPAQFYYQFSAQIAVAVGEKRVPAVQKIIQERPQTEVILLDDAFQHRAIKAGLNILITDYKRLFYKDYLLPSGRLREARRGAKRAQIVIVSKCPTKMQEAEKNTISTQIQKYTSPQTPIFFTTIHYASPRKVLPNNSLINVERFTHEIVLFSAIAQPAIFEQYMAEKYALLHHFVFPDHYYYTEADLQKIINKADGKTIFCTEKDYVKLQSPDLQAVLKNANLYYIPIKVAFLGEEDNFRDMVYQYINNAKQ